MPITQQRQAYSFLRNVSNIDNFHLLGVKGLDPDTVRNIGEKKSPKVSNSTEDTEASLRPGTEHSERELAREADRMEAAVEGDGTIEEKAEEDAEDEDGEVENEDDKELGDGEIHGDNAPHPHLPPLPPPLPFQTPDAVSNRVHGCP